MAKAGKEVKDEPLEKENPSLKGILPKVFARQNLDPASLGGLIDLAGIIALGDANTRSTDVLGHVFEYFLGEFALAEGAFASKTSGQGDIRKALIEDDNLIDCIVNLPAKLFFEYANPRRLVVYEP